MVAKINKPLISTFIDDIKVISIKGLGHIEKVNLELIITFKIVDIGLISF